MNKQELIERLERLIGYGSRDYIERNEVLDLVKQLDEPQSVKVPQFVADWYEENKDDFEFNVWDWIAFRNELEKLENKEFSYWLNDGEGNPIQTLVNMHQFGYEVEKEKRYRVKMKDVEINFNFLNRHRNENYWIFSSKDEHILYQTHHTRKELEEAGFGWVFNCEGIEIEEVEQ